jgi:glutathione-independent formaldehyde dehydrogenase
MDFNKERLAQARSFGCETVDLNQGSVPDQVEKILGVREVDCGVDCVGFEARAEGGAEQPAVVLNQLMQMTRAAGSIGIPGLYVTEDPGAKEEAARKGNLVLRFGLGWAKSHSFFTGQAPVMKYNRGLMMAVLHGRIQIAKAVNVTVISLDQAPRGYADFDRGAAHKFVIDPNGVLRGKQAS